jgi:hypothetical protein
MMMNRREALLLPVSPWFVALSLLIVLAFQHAAWLVSSPVAS